MTGMTGAAHPRLEISKVGVLIGLALLAFGLYTTVTYFRSGHGHAMTLLRALAAVPLGAVAVYLSFSTVCSACGAALTHQSIATSADRASSLMLAAAASDGTGLARALAAAQSSSGTVQVQIDACPQCRGLIRLRAPGTVPERLLAGDAARPAVDAVLPKSDASR